jgi:hypothetical protein
MILDGDKDQGYDYFHGDREIRGPEGVDSLLMKHGCVLCRGSGDTETRFVNDIEGV